MAAAKAERYKELVVRLREISRLQSIMGTLGWDEQVNLPEGASPARGRQNAALEAVIHEKKTATELSKLVDQLWDPAMKDYGKVGGFNEGEVANIRLAKKMHDRAKKIPPELVAKIAELSTTGYQTWVQAREANDWNKFAPILEEWVAIRKEMTKCIDPTKPAYDVLLDEFEPGMSTDRFTEIFDYLKGTLKPLIRKLSNASPSNCPKQIFAGKWDRSAQDEFCRSVATDMGFDFDKGRLDVSVHPFTGGGDPTDVRMTTRFKDDFLLEGIGGTVHEAGHSLYEQGRNVSESMVDLPATEALGMGVHEGQSLFWERMIYQNSAFWTAYADKLGSLFPQLSTASAEDMYRAANICNPGVIRLDADEVTYPMHIIVRFECERDLVNGVIEPRDIPEVWKAKMKEYLGKEPVEDKEGPLQDVHWSDGSFGYFPTYTLGAIIASNLYSFAQKDIPGLEDSLKKHDYGVLREWLRVQVHDKGSVYPDCDTLMRSITGNPVDARVFVDYLSSKYGQIYSV